MATVLVLVAGKRQGRRTAEWFAHGAQLAGYKAKRLAEANYTEPCSDILVHYGFDGSPDSMIAKAHADYVRAGLKAVYTDIGYFRMRGRPFDRYEDYKRFSINARHPTAYFQNIKHAGDRAAVHRIDIARNMKQGKNIILCGMSPKAAVFDDVIGWEEAAIVKIRKHSDRPIVYRPKPQANKKPQLPPLLGTTYSDPLTRKLEQELPDAWAVVSHHSNAGLDALIAGVPCFQPDGVASVLGLDDLSMIETPLLPSYEERVQLINDVCYQQWNYGEIDAGLPWRQMRDEGLL